jgi:hypothetical protein
MDPKSDVDYMVVFNDGDKRPQTYLQRLRTFANAKYTRSEVVQSNPTIILRLHHIHFELVPALPALFSQYRIPAPSTNFLDWVRTDPQELAEQAVNANRRCDHKLKPVVRLLKYWNARAGRPLSSFELESQLVEPYYFLCSSLSDYFFQAFDTLKLGWGAADWRQRKLSQAQDAVKSARSWECGGYGTTAEQEIRKLLP